MAVAYGGWNCCSGSMGLMAAWERMQTLKRLKHLQVLEGHDFFIETWTAEFDELQKAHAAMRSTLASMDTSSTADYFANYELSVQLLNDSESFKAKAQKL